MPATTTPIRVGVVGLSTQGWASVGLIPPMLKLKETPYQIVGICSSRSKSSEQIDELRKKFGANLKIYSSPQEMAKATDIDLYVVSVKSIEHEKLVLPALASDLEKKKDVFVEWPATGSLESCKQLAQKARQLGVRIMVGLQGRQCATLKKVRQIVKGENGEKGIGRIISSCMIGCVPVEAMYWGPRVVESSAYIIDANSRATMLHVLVGHFLDQFLLTFGEIASVTATQTISFPESTVCDATGTPTSKVIPVTAPDTLSFSGLTKANTLFTFHCRAGIPLTEGRTNFLWIIDGTEGSIRVEGNGWAGSFPNIIEPTLFLNGEKVEVSPEPLGNIGRAWHEIAQGESGDYATIQDAIKVHQVVQAVLDSAEDGKQMPVH